jgi:hypothetical protein
MIGSMRPHERKRLDVIPAARRPSAEGASSSPTMERRDSAVQRTNAPVAEELVRGHRTAGCAMELDGGPACPACLAYRLRGYPTRRS